jgi:TonB family protein
MTENAATGATTAREGGPMRSDAAGAAVARRLLRLGVVLAGRLVEERIVPPGAAVTAGRSLRATIGLPDDAAPACEPLFERRRGRVVLLIPRGARATVAEDGVVKVFDRPAGAAAAAGASPSPGAVALSERARGRIDLGGAAILFQLVAAPPPRPRPRLPPSLRASALSGLDGLFAALVAACFLCHAAMVLYLRTVDWPRHADPERVPDAFVRMVVRPPAPRPPAAAPAAAPDEPPAREAAAPARARARRDPAPAPPAALSDDRRRALAEKARATGLLAVLGRLGDEPGALADLLRGGAADRDQAEALRDVGGVSVATDAPALRSLLRAPAGGRVASITDLRGGAEIARAARVEGPAERRVPPVLRHEPPVVDGPLDPARLARDVRARLAALRACYERALKSNPQLAGKILVRFTVTPAGTVTGAAVDEDTIGDAGLRACLLAVIARWRFPPPAGGPAEVSFPFIFQPAP